VTSDELEELSTKGEVVLLKADSRRIRTINPRAAAPERIRMEVKLAASMPECFNAARQSRELAAKAIMASRVKEKRRMGFTTK
jgi:hypothetical protein